MEFNNIYWLYQPRPIIFNVLESTQTRIYNLNVLLKMPRKVRHLLNSQISCY
jgi:hypothetical protein